MTYPEFSGGDMPPEQRSEPEPTRIRPARSRRRGRRKSGGWSRAADGTPPVWMIAVALIIPLILAIALYFAIQSARSRASEALDLSLLMVTATPQSGSPVPFSLDQWLSATPPFPASATPDPSLVGQAPLFVSATPSFTLASSYIVFTCFVGNSDDICLMRGDGSGVIQLTEALGTDWYPSFSPDGRTIVFSSQREGQFAIFSMGADGSNPQRLTHNIGNAYAPAVSPDGSRIVFAAEADGVQNIWAVGIDGGAAVQLTYQSIDAIDPMWSPDGTQISFTSFSQGVGTLFVMNADGSNIRQLTHGINVEGRNDWSPDGQSLVFYAGPANDKDLYLVDIKCAESPTGCGTVQLLRLTDGGNNKGPGFSPDGLWIVFASEIDGDNEIFIVRADGSEVYQLTSNGRADWQPRWGWHP